MHSSGRVPGLAPKFVRSRALSPRPTHVLELRCIKRPGCHCIVEGRVFRFVDANFVLERPDLRPWWSASQGLKYPARSFQPSSETLFTDYKLNGLFILRKRNTPLPQVPCSHTPPLPRPRNVALRRDCLVCQRFITPKHSREPR